ncbi:MAG: F0F1 ATP synthase subunit B [Bacteroidaceae bacterium]|nr:F0F1 ATP synthase subunit B [Bacteroidaceae bacterium]
MSLVTPDFGLLFWMTVIFAIVFFLLAKFGFPMITGMVNKRSDYIGKSLADAREAQRQLQDLAGQQEKLIDETRREQSRILAEAASARDEIIANAREKAQSEASEMMSAARKNIEAEKESAMRDVRREVADLSVAIAEKLVRRELSEDNKQAELIDTLIDEVKSNQ